MYEQVNEHFHIGYVCLLIVNVQTPLTLTNITVNGFAVLIFKQGDMFRNER